jgi:hypothetical protein
MIMRSFTGGLVLASTCLLCALLPRTAAALSVTLSAKTLSWGKKDERSRTDDGFNVTTTKQSRAVEARVFMFEKPGDSCVVQCFFFAKDVESKDMFLFHKDEKILLNSETVVFEAPDIVNGVRASKFTTANVWLVGGGSALGTVSEYFSSKGSRFHGWLVRVIVDGKVEKVQSNQSDLAAMGKAAPAGASFKSLGTNN